MARSPFTLAALAAAAVPGLTVAGVAPQRDSDFDAATVSAADGRELLVRLPRTREADTRIRAELLGLGALTEGARARLPFSVLRLLGSASFGPTRAIVTDCPGGAPLELGELGRHDRLGAAVGRAIAATHRLPATVVTDAGLPSSGPAESRRRAAEVVARAEATALLPEVVRARWTAAIEDAELWQFQPTVIGGFDADSFHVDGDEVTTVTGWHGLSIGDPASDLAWLSQDARAADAVFSAYGEIVGQGDRRLRGRAALFAELELARWLLHGQDLRDQSIVDDAVDMLTTLAERIHGERTARIEDPTAPVLTIDEVEDLLEHTRKAV